MLSPEILCIISPTEDALVTVDTAMVVDKWDKDCSLHHWGSDPHFTLYSHPSLRLTISSAQAEEIIAALGLIYVQSHTFSSGGSYRQFLHVTDDLVLARKTRDYHRLKLEKQRLKVEVLNRHITCMVNALESNPPKA